MKVDPEFIPASEVARYLGIGVSTLYRWVQREHFPQPVRFGPGCSRWRVAEVELWCRVKQGARM